MQNGAEIPLHDKQLPASRIIGLQRSEKYYRLASAGDTSLKFDARGCVFATVLDCLGMHEY